MCGVVVGWPVKFLLEVRYEGWRRAHRARELGAVLAASGSRGKLLGDMDVAWEMREINKNGFIGRIC